MPDGGRDPICDTTVGLTPASKTPWRTGLTICDNADLLAQWDYEKNPDPSSIALYSNKVLWWTCPSGHNFQARPNDRASFIRKRGHIRQCPECYRATFSDWPWDKIVKAASAIIAERGSLPHPKWFMENGYAMLVSSLYNKQKKNWGDLRAAVAAFETGSLSPSRSGIAWRSKAEACLSDFLYARDISHGKGPRYPDGYAKASGKSYGIYDLSFQSPLTGDLIDVEVWGGRPNSGSDEDYAATRKAKEAFNATSDRFLGIEHVECYSDDKLTHVLERFIGVIEPFKFGHELDPFMASVRWSEGPGLFEECKALAAAQPTQTFPSEAWLRKIKNHKNREGPSYTTMADKIIRTFGGFEPLRKLLGKSNWTRWTRESALAELAAFMKKYGRTPMEVVGAARRGSTVVPPEEVKRANRINQVASKYFGGVTNALKQISKE